MSDTMKRTIAFILISILLLTSASAGPFGIELGWSIDDLLAAGAQIVYPTEESIRKELQRETETGMRSAILIFPIDIVPPSPSDLFTFYQITLSNDLGIYEIEAYEGSSQVYLDQDDDDNYAIQRWEAQEIFDRTNNSLTIKYGTGRDFFFDEDHKLWDWEDNQEHMDIELILNKSRTFESIYEFDEALDDFATIDQYDNGLYCVSLTYNQEEYLQAVKDAEIL